MEEKIVNWIKEYVKNSNAKGVVVGNSGGKDSAAVIALCAKALGKENVLAVIMPCKGKKEDVEDAELVASITGVKSMIVDLDNVYDNFEEAIKIGLNEEAKINIKPRLRMTVLYAIAQTMGYLVCRNRKPIRTICRIYYKMGRQCKRF